MKIFHEKRCYYLRIAVASVCLAALWGTQGTLAAAADPPPERPWELMLGVGGIYQPEYSGSQEMALAPVPLVFGQYRFKSCELFVKGDEAGVHFKPADELPVSFDMGVKLGDIQRDHDERALLRGTAALENTYQLFGGLILSTPLATVSSRLRYVPVSADYAGVERKDVEYDGLLVDLAVEKEWFVLPFLIQVSGGVSWMNDAYASANYGVEYATERLPAFSAESGIRSLNVSSNASLFFSERVGVTLLLGGEYLLDSAADSPFTEEAFQPHIGLFTFYRF